MTWVIWGMMTTWRRVTTPTTMKICSSGSADDVVSSLGNYDQEFNNALSSDRSAILPNTRPKQASYNKPDDWRERNRIGLTNLKRQLQSCIDSLAPDLSGSFDLRLGSNSRWGQQQLLRDNEEPIVWHQPILDEYWNRLEAEIDQQRQQEIVTILIT
jgi:hypothetical protein